MLSTCLIGWFYERDGVIDDYTPKSWVNFLYSSIKRLEMDIKCCNFYNILEDVSGFLEKLCKVQTITTPSSI